MGRKKTKNKHFPKFLQQKEDGSFYYVRYLNKTIRWFSLRTKDEAKAFERCSQLNTKVENEQAHTFDIGGIDSNPNHIKFDTFLNKYIEEVTRRKSKSTQKNELRGCEILRKKFGEKYLHEIERSEIIRFHHDFRETPYQANRFVGLMRHILQHALDWGCIKINPADKIKKNREKRFELKLTTEILFNKIYPVANPQLKTAIMLAFHLVQHPNEIKKLQWKNFDFTNKIASFRRDKTGEPIVINYSLNDVLITYLNKITKERTTLSPYIITHKSKSVGGDPYGEFRSPWRRALKDAGLGETEYKFKEIRHLANTCLKDMDITVDKRSAMTGHKSNATNEIYTHKTGTDTLEASKALSSYKPKEF